MKNLISTKQLMYSVAAFIIASSLLTRSLYAYTKNETWIPVVIAAVVSFFIIEMYCILVRDHPGLSLFEINEAVFGAVVGKSVSALYVFFFLSLTLFNTRDVGTFIKAMLLPNTPMGIIYIVFLFVCVWAVRKGAQSMTRYSALITFVYIAAVVFNGMLLLNKSKLENLLPIFSVPVKNYLLGAHIVTMLPFCEVLAFLTITQYMRKPGEVGKALKGGLLIAALVLVTIILRDIVVLGNYALLTSMPAFNVIRLIDIGDILTRLEIIYAVLFITMLFYKVAVLLFATVQGISKLFSIAHYRIFVVITAALAIVYANAVFLSNAEHTQWFRAAATYSTFFVFVLPLMTLVVSIIKKYRRTTKGSTG